MSIEDKVKAAKLARELAQLIMEEASGQQKEAADRFWEVLFTELNPMFEAAGLHKTRDEYIKNKEKYYFK